MLKIQRIFWPQIETSDQRARLFSFLNQHRELTDGLSLFTEGDGTDWRYLPPDEVERRAAILDGAAHEARALGFVVHLNVLNTLGHSDDGGMAAPLPPWRPAVDMNGTHARICGCLADDRLVNDVRSRYARFGRIAADVFWIDDDLRIASHFPVRWGCFCEVCVGELAAAAGLPAEREKIVATLHRDLGLRGIWRERNARLLRRIFTAAVEGLQAVRPEVQVGLMTGDLRHLADAAVDPAEWFSSLPVTHRWLRPGPGFWEDREPDELWRKLHGASNTASRFPAPSTQLLYEVENYPYTPASKSAFTTARETLLMVLTTPCGGAMFNLIDMTGNDPGWQARWFERLASSAHSWEAAAELVQGTHAAGWRLPYSDNHFVQHANPIDFAVESRPDYLRPISWLRAGVPVTGDVRGELGALLSGEMAQGMVKEELLDLLRRPLAMDGAAAARYVALGLGERIGVARVEDHGEGVFEEMTSHPLNGAAAGCRRAATLCYFGERSSVLQLADDAQVLSDALDYRERRLGAASSIFTPAGRPPVAVFGHLPWRFVHGPQRMSLLQRFSHFCLCTHLPVQILTEEACAVTHRVNASGRLKLSIVANAGFDEAFVSVVPDSSMSCPQLALKWGDVTADIETDRTNLRLAPWAVAVVSWPE